MAASLPAPGSNRGLIALRVRVPGHDSAHARPRATSSLSCTARRATRARHHHSFGMRTTAAPLFAGSCLT